MHDHDTWIRHYCEHCEAQNWVCLGNMSDYTVPDIGGYDCHDCGRENLLVTEAELEDMCMSVDDLHFVKGRPRQEL